ncbi:MAG: hypothetical protein H6509_08545 [Bryobacterales bacterium]|nr:hypothetical protein [Bryobacterales bacterium]
MHLARRMLAACAALLCGLPLGAGVEWPALQHRAEPLAANAAAPPMAGRDLAYLQTPHSPGVLVRMQTQRMTFFADLASYGAEAPTLLFARTAGGVKTLRRGETLAGEEMTASWLVTSFQGAKGWESFDVPWFLSLERRPVSVTLTAAGLQLDFAEPDSGRIFSMPLYGYDKPPQKDHPFAAEHGLPSSGVEPWTWAESFPPAVAERCDWWASVAKAYPVGFRESFRVDPSDDRIDFRQQYRWLTIEDDWQTQPRRFAVLPPSVALARTAARFPLEVSGVLHDPGYWTAYGPLAGIADVDTLEYSLRLLQYLHDAETVRVEKRPSPAAAEALRQIESTMEGKFPQPWRYDLDHGDRANLCWNIAADVWYARALSLLDPQMRQRASQSMRVYMGDDVIQPHKPFHGKYLLEGPGIGSWGERGDAGKFMTLALQPIYAFASNGNGWDLIRERWDLVKRFFVTPDEANWLSFGRYSIAEIGDEAAPCSAYARLALGVGDIDEYLFGAYMFSREMVHLTVKQTGGESFYRHQPLHELEAMPERIYPTDMWGSTVGWQVDGPEWGHLSSGEHQSANRWVRFQDPDVGRYYRDRLAQSVGEELDWYDTAANEERKQIYRAETYRDWRVRDDAHIMPSRLRLQSLLLDEGQEGNRAIGALRSVQAAFPASRIATAYSVLRLNAPREMRRLAPLLDGPSPWVVGLERNGLSDSASPVQEVLEDGLTLEPTWYGWGMPRNAPEGGALGRRSFGRIHGDFGAKVRGAEGREWVSYGVEARWADATDKRTVPDASRALREQDRTLMLVSGPYPNAHDEEILTQAYAPEREPLTVEWKTERLLSGRRVDFGTALSEIDAAPSLAYVMQYVWAPRETDVFLSAGHQGGLVAWINKDRVIETHDAHRPTGDDAVRGLGRLHAGWNYLLLKAESLTDERSIQFRLTGLDSQPLPGLRFSDRPDVEASSGGR